MRGTYRLMAENQAMGIAPCFLPNQRRLPVGVLSEEGGMNGAVAKCYLPESAEVLAQLTTTYNRT